MLADEPWVYREPGSGTRELFDEVIASQQGTPRVGMTLNQAEAVKRAVCDDPGVACIARIAARSMLESGHLATIDVAGLNLKRHLYLLTHRKSTAALF